MDNWKKTLSDLFKQREEEKALEIQKYQLEGQRNSNTKQDISNFISTAIKPAFVELKTELEKYGRRVKILKNEKEGAFFLTILVENDVSIPSGFKYIEEFVYTIISNVDAEVSTDIKYTENKIIKVDLRNCYISSQEDSNIYNIAKDDIIDNFVFYYEKFI
jgi:hypothetical protein